MNLSSLRPPRASRAGIVFAAMLSALGSAANAADQLVTFTALNTSTTLATPLARNDTLIIEVDFLNQTSALSFKQVVNFTLAPGATLLYGRNVWTEGAPLGASVASVDINIFNASTNALVVSDDSQLISVIPGLADLRTSTFQPTAVAAGSYRLEINGTTVAGRSVALNASVSAVPEPGSAAMLFAGLAALGFMVRRRG